MKHLILQYLLLTTLIPLLECSLQNCTTMNISVTSITLQGDLLADFSISPTVGFIVTTSGAIYRSTDGGLSWGDISYKLDDFDQVTGSSLESSFYTGDGVRDYWVHGDAVYLKGAGWKLWVSTDFGETFSLYYTNSPEDVFYIQGHPTQEEWVLALSRGWGTCCGYYCYCKNKVSISKDYGASWTVIMGDVDTDYGAYKFSSPGFTVNWGSAGTKNPDESLYVIGWDSQVQSSTNAHLFYWEDGVFQKLGTESFEDGAMAFVYIPEQNSVVVGVYPTIFDFHIYLSNLDEDPVTFQRELFQYDNTNDNPGEISIIRFLDYDLGSMFLSINREYHNSYTEDLFVSDVIHGDFSISLRNVASNANSGYIDFSQVEGVAGAYLANIWVDGKKQSRITFDNGALWYPLEASNCTTDDCHLHIHGPTTTNENYYTSASVVGTILSSGNVGAFITPGESDIYLSRDGGRDWDFIYAGDWKFEILNRGSLITLFSKQPTSSVKYTADQGDNWNDCIFVPDEEDQLSNEVIHLKPALDNNLALLNVVTRTTYNGSDTTYRLWTLDYSATLRECEDEDFELFYPRAEYDDCILGRRTQYLRLKQESVCRVTRNIDEEVYHENCNCTRQDYVCNYCYDLVGEECVFDTSCNIEDVSPSPESCQDGETYEGRPKFRKVAGTFCENDIPEYLEPDVIPCPITTPPTTTVISDSTTSTPSTVYSSTGGPTDETSSIPTSEETTLNTPEPASITSSTSTSTSTSSTDQSSTTRDEILEEGHNDFTDQPLLTLTLLIFTISLLILLILTIFLYHQTAKNQTT